MLTLAAQVLYCLRGWCVCQHKAWCCSDASVTNCSRMAGDEGTFGEYIKCSASLTEPTGLCNTLHMTRVNLANHQIFIIHLLYAGWKDWGEEAEGLLKRGNRHFSGPLGVLGTVLDPSNELFYSILTHFTNEFESWRGCARNNQNLAWLTIELTKNNFKIEDWWAIIQTENH